MIYRPGKPMAMTLLFCLLLSDSVFADPAEPAVLDVASHVSTVSPLNELGSSADAASDAADAAGVINASNATSAGAEVSAYFAGHEGLSDSPGTAPSAERQTSAAVVLGTLAEGEITPLSSEAEIARRAAAEEKPAQTASEEKPAQTAAEEKNPVTAAGTSGPVKTAGESSAPEGVDGRSGKARAIRDRKLNNFDDAPVFGGGEVRFLENKGGRSQQLSAVIRSPEGRLLVVDGGRMEDKAHLISNILELGGTVDAWLITHPQADHIGALMGILQDEPEDIEIRNVYYHFLEDSFYKINDPAEYGSYWVLKEELEKLPAERVHGHAGRGDFIRIGSEMSVRVLNDPQRSSGAYAVNASGLMYDISLSGQHIIILGDMSEAVGDRLLAEGILEGVHCDYVQMAHHGQQGVSEAFYKALKPEYCIWPTFAELFLAKESNGMGFKTHETIAWMEKLGVKQHYVTVGGDVVLR